jgi:hypothetical protein
MAEHPDSQQQASPESASPESASPESAEGQEGGERVVVVTTGGMGVAGPGAHGHDEDGEPRGPTDLVEHPAKVMRIGSMVKSLLEEVRNAPLDEAGRAHLAQVHARSIAELKDGLAPELVEELDRLALPLGDGSPSDAELRVAQAQLVGWLEGLFHGIQTALVAQQMAAQAQLQQMRQLPPGMRPGQGPAPGGRPGPPSPPPHEGTGQYL